MCAQRSAQESQLTGSVQLAKMQKEQELEIVARNLVGSQIFFASPAGDGFAAHNCLPTEKMERVGPMIQNILRLFTRESTEKRMKKCVQFFLAGTNAIKLH